MPDGGLRHLDEQGRLRMVDVGDKEETKRTAVAACTIAMAPATMQAVTGGGAPKGDVLGVAQVAGIQAAKRTPDLIPGCHQVRLSAVTVSFDARGDTLVVRAEARGTDRTGFEMEALTACAVAALTVYDMVKGIDSNVRIDDVHLVSKEGGSSGRS